MRFVTLSTAATLWVDLPARADATPTFVVRNPAGGTIQSSASVTLGTSNTTLSGAAAAGASTVSVTSASGIAAGRKFLIGGPEESGGERVTVRSVSGTTITLVRPLRAAKASGAAFASTRVDLAIDAGTPSTIGRHWRAEITWAVSSVSQAVHVVPFDVVRYQPLTSLEGDDIADLDPLLAKRLPAGLWLPATIEAAWDMILRRLAQQKDPGALVGAIDLTTPHQYLVRKLLAETGATNPELLDHAKFLGERYVQELETALASAAVDDDQDGAVEKHEGWTKTLDLARG